MTAEMLTTKDVLARGWTRPMVGELLHPPDMTRESKTRTGRKYETHLYSAERVLTVEASPKWAARKAAIARRQRSAAKGRARAAAELVAWLPHIPRHSIEKLRVLATDNYNRKAFRRWMDDDSSVPRAADQDSEPDFVARLCVNYLRHEASNYDWKIEVADRLRKDYPDLVKVLKLKVLEAIRVVYPELVAECERQARRAETLP